MPQEHEPQVGEAPHRDLPALAERLRAIGGDSDTPPRRRAERLAAIELAKFIRNPESLTVEEIARGRIDERVQCAA